ncbi:MAG: imidazolonepropionase [Thermoflexales bacterium]|nr:imidazolonepropionase [Thermoflexales bacterium]
METVDLLIHSASQLCVVPSPGGPQRGHNLGELGIIQDGALAVRGERILAVGTTSELRAAYTARQEIDAAGRVVIPGFVDPHTHLVWAGERAAEFELRVGGASYMEIMAAGGGIASTVRQTRQASIEALVAQCRARLDRMLAHGTTTVEVKTGYGLDTANELKLLEAIARLDRSHPVDLVPTFLGAHAVPPEYTGREDEYVKLITMEMLPAIQEHLANSHFKLGGRPELFCDVFCDEGAFTLAQTRRILERAKALGFGLKIHVDEFKSLGGARLGVELGATSVDHFVVTPPEEVEAVACSNVIAVSLPGTPFGLAHRDYSPARLLLDHGGALALATDCNPGTCWCESMQFIIALACRAMQLSPAQALAAATLNAAYAVGRGEQTGSLEPGKLADALILDAPDYRHLGYRFGTNLVRSVVKRGELVINN